MQAPSKSASEGSPTHAMTVVGLNASKPATAAAAEATAGTPAVTKT